MYAYSEFKYRYAKSTFVYEQPVSKDYRSVATQFIDEKPDIKIVISHAKNTESFYNLSVEDFFVNGRKYTDWFLCSLRLLYMIPKL